MSAITLADAKAAHNAARAALAAAVRHYEDDKAAAVAIVDARHAAALKAAREAMWKAAGAERDATDREAPDHAWEGLRVYRVETEGSVYSRRTKRVEGIVQTVRQSTVLPGNVGGYRRPGLGDVIVRAVKKDGAPGLRFHPFEDRWNPWKLAEPEGVAVTPEGTREASKPKARATKPNDPSQISDTEG